MSHSHHNLLGEPPATLLPPHPEADAELAEGTPPAEVASRPAPFATPITSPPSHATDHARRASRLNLLAAIATE